MLVISYKMLPTDMLPVSNRDAKLANMFDKTIDGNVSVL